MLKILVVLLFALLLQAIGIVLMSKGLHEIGDIKRISASEVARVIIHGATNTYVLLGLLFLVLFFGCLLYLLSQEDVSLIWPLKRNPTANTNNSGKLIWSSVDTLFSLPFIDYSGTVSKLLSLNDIGASFRVSMFG